MQTYCGIDIGGTQIKIGLFGIDGTLLNKWAIDTNKENNGQFILEEIYTFLKETIDMTDCLGFGFGVPGPVKDDIVLECVNLGWGKTNVKALFQALVGQEKIITVDNDANVAALGEATFGAGDHALNTVMLTLGTGVGGGIILNGAILKGVNGSAGELGHMPMVDDGFLCGCGKHGCLETLTSATGVKNLARMYLEEGRLSSRLSLEEDFSAKYVFDNAKRGDEVGLKVVDDVAYYLAKACAQIAVTVDPESFIFGGGVSAAGDFLFDKVKAYYQTLAFKAVRDVLFKPAELGNDAGIYGAFMAVKNHG